MPDDYVVCMECGRKRRFINTPHLKMCSGIDNHEYKRRYPDAPIMCIETIETKRGENNSAHGGLGTFAGRKHTEETKKKMRENQLGEKNTMYGRRGLDAPSHYRTGDKNPMTGRKGPKHHSYGKTGKDCPKFGKKWTKESREKLSKARAEGIRNGTISLKGRVTPFYRFSEKLQREVRCYS